MIRVKDLPVSPKGEILHCSVCGNTYSAHKGDYFMRDPEEVMKCCDMPLTLTKKVLQIVPVSEVSDDRK